MKRTAIKARPRSKGNRGELAVIYLLRDLGWQPRRNWQSGGQGGGDIINGPADVHLEVKHHERCAIWEWIDQAEGEARPTDIPMVVCRRNHMPWWAVMPRDEADALVELLSGRHSFTDVYVDKARASLWNWLEKVVDEAQTIPTAIPRVMFNRPGGPEYVAMPAMDAFEALRIRETA